MARRHNWTPEQVDAQEDGFVEELLAAEVGWDMAIARRQADAASAGPSGGGGQRPLYGMRGMAG